jgi:hypothetical protein
MSLPQTTFSSGYGSIFSGSCNSITSTTNCTIYSGSLNSGNNNTITIANPNINYSGGYIISQPKCKYVVMGVEFEVEGYQSFETASFLSLITVNGWRYYEEMLKNGVNVYGEVKDVLERLYLEHTRDKKINDILETKTEG